MLYLNNNYHAVHHALLSLPWWQLPAAWQADQDGWLRRNGGFRLDGYGPLVRRFALTPIDTPVHPASPPRTSRLAGARAAPMVPPA